MEPLTQDNDHYDEALRQGKSLGSELREQLSMAGCFAPATIPQTFHMLLVILLYGSGYTALLLEPTIGLRLTALILLAFASVQAGYIAHEAGHGAITKNRRLVRLIGQFFNTFLTALCYSRFQKIHICHHGHCNKRDRDIDIQSNLFSLYPEAVRQKSNRSNPLPTGQANLLSVFLTWTG